MVWWRCFIISIVCLMLSACASTVMMQHMQLGKNYFNDGNYKPAFRQLLPVAVYGRPEAQYAVGYMYYYGYGVPMDPESGLFWMHRAADQGYGPAIHALIIIDRGPDECGTGEYRCRGGMAPCSFKESGCQCDPVLHSIPRRGCPPPTQVCHEPPAVLKKSGVLIRRPPPVYHGEHPVLMNRSMAPVYRHESFIPQKISQNNSYGLQLLGAFKLDHVKNLQNELQLSHNTRIWHTQHQNKDWYVLTYGHYASISDAKLARNHLPSEVKDLEPWVRKLNGLDQVG